MEDESFKTRKRICNTLLNAKHHHHASIVRTQDLKRIVLHFDREYMADFDLEWCEVKQHFRVYICVASTGKEKARSGYPICVIKNGATACEFISMYNFLVINRAGQR